METWDPGCMRALEEGEEIVRESSICDVEFDKQEETIRKLIGEKIKGRAICKSYLTDKRILMWLIVVPDKKEMEPKSGWFSFPHTRLRYVKPNQRRKRYKKQGLELEYENLTLNEILTGEEVKLKEEKGIRARLSSFRGDEKTKFWLLVPDSQTWYIKINQNLRA